MQTLAVTVMNLCVPCENRCRYCLLSYDGKITGVDYKRSEIYARRFYEWLGQNRPDIHFSFGFGYSMEHPQLLNAIDFCQSIHSPTGEFLQFDGMKFRSEEQLYSLLSQLKAHGIRLIDLTFYGTEQYHDRFAGRSGDYRLMLNTLKQCNKLELDVTVTIPLTCESAPLLDALLHELETYKIKRISLFVPHGEGRGRHLQSIRLTEECYARLSEHAKTFFNTARFKTEKQWLLEGFPALHHRALTVTLTPDTVNFFENLPFDETIRHLEQLDDHYFSVIPPVEELAEVYGNPESNLYYSARDLYLLYQAMYIKDRRLSLYDINDERHCFVRRF